MKKIEDRDMIPITKPTLPKFEELKAKFQKVIASGMLTNSKYVKEFEKNIGNYLGVKNAIAVSSCTSGLMLVQKILGLRGEIILPSFTFSATGHSVMWNSIKPVFVDIEPGTYTIDPKKVEGAITPRTSAILAVHIFGNPCDVDRLQKIASDNNLKLIFDAAHAFGSKINGEYISSFGDAEVFSCSPTKLLVTGEGGIVATKSDEFAELVKIGRNYGDDGSYDCKFAGMNARMEEFNAILGIETLKMIEKNIKRRNELVALYKKELSQFDGITFQKIRDGCKSTFKDFSIYIDKEKFGIDRNKLYDELLKKSIISKKYFYPPLHKQRAYRRFFKKCDKKLPVTNDISNNVLSLPLYSHMPEEEVYKVIKAIKSMVK